MLEVIKFQCRSGLYGMPSMIVDLNKLKQNEVKKLDEKRISLVTRHLPFSHFLRLIVRVHRLMINRNILSLSLFLSFPTKLYSRQIHFQRPTAVGYASCASYFSSTVNTCLQENTRRNRGRNSDRNPEDWSWNFLLRTLPNFVPFHVSKPFDANSSLIFW